MDSEDITKRSFTIRDLRQPGGWRKCDDLFDLFSAAESFVIDFSDSNLNPAGQKVGFAKLIFKDFDSACQAYNKAQLIKISNRQLVLDSSSSFSDSCRVQFLDILSGEEADSTLYFFHIPKEKTLNDIIEFYKGFSEIIKTSCIEHPLSRQISVTFASVDVLNSARHYGLVHDLNSMNANAYRIWSKRNNPDSQVGQHKNKNNDGNDAGEGDAVDDASIEMAEPTEDEIIQEILEYINRERVNIASDWHTCKELYKVLDDISAKFGGIADSLLKPCMLKALTQYCNAAEKPDWMKNHLNTTINMWKREVKNEKPFERSTKVPLPSHLLLPPPPSTSSCRKKNRGSNATQRFGVGNFLQQAKTILTSTGSALIDQDDSGNIDLNGEPLTFDLWARMNTVTTPVPEKPTYTRDKTDNWDAERFAKRMAYKASRKQRKALEAAIKLEKQKELEEGEVDSGDERQTKRRRAISSSSDSSSSSRTDSDNKTKGDAPNDSRGRRRERRKNRRSDISNSNMARYPTGLQKWYGRRFELMKLLSDDLRFLFAIELNLVISNSK